MKTSDTLEVRSSRVQGTSSETQRQIVGTRKSLNERENMALCFLAPIRSQNGGDRLELVW